MELPRAERLERPAAGSRCELRDRLSNLPPGHPSAPLDERGVPRAPAPRLADLETEKPPLSDAAYAARRDEVAKILRQAHGALQAVEEQKTVNPDKDIWSDDRIAGQDAIVKKLYAAAASVPCEGKAIIAGGLGGSGKTTVLADQRADPLPRA